MATAAWFSDIPGSMGLGSNPWSGSDGVPLRGSQLGCELPTGRSSAW